jgi:hypothetical protein
LVDVGDGPGNGTVIVGSGAVVVGCGLPVPFVFVGCVVVGAGAVVVGACVVVGAVVVGACVVVCGSGVNVVVGVGTLSSPTPARLGKSWTSMFSVTTFMTS